MSAQVERPLNFFAGPAILPTPVIEEAARGVLSLEGLGLSILEISHRSKTFDDIIVDARARLKRLLAVPDTHDILFLQGGARGQFASVPLNFLRPGQRGGYVVSGHWANLALQEGARLGEVTALASSAAADFSELPALDGIELGSDLAYVHTTSNNTLYGTQWAPLPTFGAVPHVCDMSSDFLSRPLNVSDFHLIYAGAQKNAGPAGVTLVIIDKAWMASAREDIASIWRYETHAKKDSLHNTPPCVAIYVVGLVAKWLEDHGGLAAMAALNERKGAALYAAMEASSGFYRPTVSDPAHRSLMNVTWRLPTPALEATFVAESTAAGLLGLKGHRKVGGIRASIYNAMTLEGVERLVDFMQGFRRAHG